VAVPLQFSRVIPSEKESAMLDNATYDLMETASVMSKGLHRYDQFMKDSKDCQACQQIWTMMKTHDEAQLHRVVDHLKQHFEQARRPAAAA
jgi:hypothetical protein